MPIFLKRRLFNPILVVIAALGIAGCSLHDPCGDGPGHKAVVATLYFGRNIPGGGTVSETDWQRFLGRAVTAAFPNGLTVSDGVGQWSDPVTHQIVTERSKIVTIVVFGDPALAAKLARIRESYRTMFHQNSVGLTLALACAAF